MHNDILNGEIAVIAVYLDEPEDRQPSGEPVDLSFFLRAAASVTQLDRVVEEPYLIDCMDSKTWKL